MYREKGPGIWAASDPMGDSGTKNKTRGYIVSSPAVYPDDAVSRFLQNIGTCLPNYASSQKAVSLNLPYWWTLNTQNIFWQISESSCVSNWEMSISEAKLILDSGIHGGTDILQPGRRTVPADTPLLQPRYKQWGRLVSSHVAAQGQWKCCSKYHHSSAEPSGSVREVGARLRQQVAVTKWSVLWLWWVRYFEWTLRYLATNLDSVARDSVSVELVMSK